MEILGLVWAASLLNQTASTAPMIAPQALDALGGSPQDEVFGGIEGMDVSEWFIPMAQAYGWHLPEATPGAQFSSYTPLTSWLVPPRSTLAALPTTPDRTTFPWGTLSPHLISSLASLGLEPWLGTEVTPEIVTLPTAGTLPTTPPVEPEADVQNPLGWEQVAAVQIRPPEGDVESEGEVDTALGGQQSPPEDRAVDLPVPEKCLPDTDVPYQARPIALRASPRWQLWVHDHYIGEVAGQVSAQRLAQSLRSHLQASNVEPDSLRPVFGQSFAGVSLNGDLLFVVDETMRPHPEMPAAAIAVQWVNNLRVALDTAPLGLAQVQMAVQGLQPTDTVMGGTASWYGPGFHGRTTANGEKFDQYELTAAHKTLPFGTQLLVRNRLNGKTVVVRINDRGPYIGQRSLDLSKLAAQCLGSESRGVIPYEAVILESASTPDPDELLTSGLQ